jgi:hypothetical protein
MSHTRSKPEIPSSVKLTRPSTKRMIDFDWLMRAANLPGKTLHVACVLWHIASIQRKAVFLLPPYALRMYGVSRDCSYDSLRRLRAAGLIYLRAGRGRAPLVTLIDRERHLVTFD